MSMTAIVIVCICIVSLITGLFLIAVNWGYKVKHTIDEVTHHSDSIAAKNEKETTLNENTEVKA
ncbi:YtzI protein [Lysinibacillus sp. 2017]|uniref:YtzI protein n=1 Tax=unclassified Lysinibacillus TaxID=2636778 RepID=UPI000D5274F9|nr:MULTISPECIES: YtzI protein [unclassified Lysinibacillus]AWE08411.1 YtzI protein [Lysinibacillus sp. 2017]TGN35742.1 YtzI protein [Lysinibacillus sp. S2017]